MFIAFNVGRLIAKDFSLTSNFIFLNSKIVLVKAELDKKKI